MPAFSGSRVHPEVAVLFDRLGPYHGARLGAAAARMELVAIEFCSDTREYAWDPVATEGDFRRVTLFPGKSSQDVSVRQCRERLFAELDAALPATVAVPGWATAFALSALEWCRRRRRPAIIMSESTSEDGPRRPWVEAIKRRVVSLGSAGLVGGEPHSEYLADLGIPPDRTFLGYDVVDNAYFENGAAATRAQAPAARAALGLPERFFLASCRFIAKKNLLVFLEAYQAYRSKAGAKAWALVLLGDGPQRSELLRRIGELDIAGDVQLPGFKQYAELPAYYALASGFVHPSSTEPWGLVVNEAMASGIPVLVSAACGCARDLVEESGNGWAFDPQRREAISECLQRLADLPEGERQTMGRRSREIIARWSPTTFAEGLQNAVAVARATGSRPCGWADRLLLRMLMARV